MDFEPVVGEADDFLLAKDLRCPVRTQIGLEAISVLEPEFRRRSVTFAGRAPIIFGGLA